MSPLSIFYYMEKKTCINDINKNICELTLKFTDAFVGFD